MNKYKTTKAAILEKLNNPLVIKNIELPKKLYRGQVLVKMKYTGICGSQIGEISGIKGPDKYLPHLLGHEGFGQVIEVGPGVRYVKKNDMVVLHWKPGKGIEAINPQYKSMGKIINAGKVTTFSNLTIVSENRLTSIKKKYILSEYLMPLFGCAVTTGFGVVDNFSKNIKNKNVVIFGAGGVGLTILKACLLKNAKNIIIVDKTSSKLKLAKKLGATYILNSTNLNLLKNIKSLLGVNGVDVFFDNTGNTKIIEIGYDLINKNGKLILVGVPKYDKKISIHTLPLHFGKMIHGTHGGNINPNLDIIKFIKLHKNKKVNYNNLVTDIFPFKKINTAISMMQKGKINGRCIIRF